MLHIVNGYLSNLIYNESVWIYCIDYLAHFPFQRKTKVVFMCAKNTPPYKNITAVYTLSRRLIGGNPGNICCTMNIHHSLELCFCKRAFFWVHRTEENAHPFVAQLCVMVLCGYVWICNKDDMGCARFCGIRCQDHARIVLYTNMTLH